MDRKPTRTAPTAEAGAGSAGAPIPHDPADDTDCRAIFAVSSDGLVVTDLERGLVVEANPAFCRMHGYAREELIGRPPTQFVHPDFHPLIARYPATIRAGGALRAAVRDVRKDGSVFPVELHGSLFRFHGRPHALGVVRALRDHAAPSRHLTERTRELSTLLAASQSVASTLELEPLLELILDHLKVVADYAGASVCTIEGADLRIRASRGAMPADREEGAIGLRLPLARGGILWETVRRQEAVIIADVRSGDPLARAYRAWLEVEFAAPAFRYVRSWLGVPLTVDDRVIGLISLSTREPGSYTPHHARLATAIASQAALAIEKARLYRQAQEESRKTAALARIAASVALAGSLETILRGLAQSVVEATGAEASAVVLTEGEPPRPRDAGAYGLPEGYGPAMAEAVRRGGPVFSLVTLEQERPLVLRDVWPALLARPELAPIHDFYSQVQWDTVVAAPLIVRGRRLGTLTCYYRSDRVPDAEAIAFQGAIADQAAVAVENARLFAEAHERAVLEERTRLAHELHDSATQTVFSVGMLARAAQTQHAQGSAQLGATLERVARLAQDALLEMRALLVELRPETLVEHGLDGALTRLVELLRPRTGMAISYRGASVPRLAADTELALFRIVQEALGNAVKHAEASAAEVRLCVEAGTLTVTVHDNGRGFDPAASVSASADGQRGGQGLRSMRERAAAGGLLLRVDSAPGAGTTVTAEAALPS